MPMQQPDFLIVHTSERDIANGRVTGLDLQRMRHANKIKAGARIKAKVIAPGIYPGLDSLFAADGFSVEVDGPDTGQAMFQGKADGAAGPPAGFPYDHDFNAAWGNKGGWIFGNGDLTVGAAIVIKNFTNGKYATNLGGICRNAPGNLIIKGDGVRPDPVITNCDDNLRLTTAGAFDFTFVMDADISGGGHGDGQTHNTYDESFAKFYIRTRSANDRVGHNFKLIARPDTGGIAVIAHCDMRNDGSLSKTASYDIDLNSELAAIYGNRFNDEANDQNQGTCVHQDCRRIYRGRKGVYFFGNSGRFAVPYRGMWLVFDNTAWDPRYKSWSEAKAIGFHPMTVLVANNDERAVDMKLDYASLGKIYSSRAVTNAALKIIDRNNHLGFDDETPSTAKLAEEDFQEVPFGALLPRTADGWNIDVVKGLVEWAKADNAAWQSPIDLAALPPLPAGTAADPRYYIVSAPVTPAPPATPAPGDQQGQPTDPPAGTSTDATLPGDQPKPTDPPAGTSTDATLPGDQQGQPTDPPAGTSTDATQPGDQQGQPADPPAGTSTDATLPGDQQGQTDPPAGTSTDATQPGDQQGQPTDPPAGTSADATPAPDDAIAIAFGRALLGALDAAGLKLVKAA